MAKMKKTLHVYAAILLSLTMSINGVSLVSFVYAGTEAFRVVGSGYSADYGAEATIYEHRRSGGTVLYLDADDEEKFFSIGFKTPPEDSRGASHILEHAMLQGSKNYPVKNLFPILRQNSTDTFINAMTSEGFTYYTIASFNKKEYQNLMRIYLDAVFYPNVLTDENIFKQEGVRIDADSEGNLNYTGVVYSEMEGYVSQPQYLLKRLSAEALFPDTHYRYDYGGRPAYIQDLTYEQLKTMHADYYVPENALAVLYGHQDIDASLKILDGYFSGFEKKGFNIELKKQEPFSETNYMTGTYPAEPDASSCHMSVGYAFPGEAGDEVYVSADILRRLLMGSDQAPLSKKLYEIGLADEYNVGINPPYMGLFFNAMNIDKANTDAFESLLEQSLREIADEGFTTEYLDSVFNAYRFGKAMEKNDFDYGFQALYPAMFGWMYEKDPLAALNRDNIIASLKEKGNSDYFTGMIRSLILNNPHKAVCVLDPDRDFNAKKDEATAQKLKALKEKLGKEGLEKLQAETDAFYQWQSLPPTQAQLDTIPKLSIEDVGENEINIDYKIENVDDLRLIHTDVQTNGVGCVNIYFDAQAIPQEKLQYAALAAMLMGNVATYNYSRDDLLLAKNNIINRFSAGLKAFPVFLDVGRYKPVFSVGFMTLEDNVPQAMDLTKEIIQNSDFGDQAYVSQYLTSYLASYQTSKEDNALNSLMSTSTGEAGLYGDYVSGYGFHSFLEELQGRLSTDWDEIYAKLEDVKNTVFRQDNMVISFTGDSANYRTFRTKALDFAKSFSPNSCPAERYSFTPYAGKTALAFPVQRLNVGLSGLIAGESAADGRLVVVSKLIRMDYLWPIIREKNGAYGVDCYANLNGLVALVSYRDPKLTETIEAYKSIPEYLKSFSMSQDDLNSVILSAVSVYDQSCTGGTNAWDMGADFYFRCIDSETLNRRRRDMLATTVEDVRNYAGLYEKVISQGRYIVTGAEKIIHENSAFFDEILTGE